MNQKKRHEDENIVSVDACFLYGYGQCNFCSALASPPLLSPLLSPSSVLSPSLLSWWGLSRKGKGQCTCSATTTTTASPACTSAATNATAPAYAATSLTGNWFSKYLAFSSAFSGATCVLTEFWQVNCITSAK